MTTEAEKQEKSVNIPSWCATMNQVMYVEKVAHDKGESVSSAFNEMIDEWIKKQGGCNE